jgi:hypothetical protein
VLPAQPPPQPAAPQLWNLPWWHCSSGSCVDTSINEIEYIERVITTIKSKVQLDTNKVGVSWGLVGGV